MRPNTRFPPVILLTGDGLEHLYVAGRLLEELPSLEIIIEPSNASRRRKGGAKRALRKGAVPFLQKVLRNVFLRLIGDRQRRTNVLRRHLGESRDTRSRFEDAMRTPTVNSQEVIARIKEIGPACVLVYGTGLVRRPVIEAAESRMLNLHTGLSPYYRGVACHLWPLVDRRFDRVGVTVHDCVLQLDAGGILGTSRTEIQANDGVHDVFARQVIDGAQLYVELVQRELSGMTVPRSEQDLGSGREFRGWELGFTAELRARLNLRQHHRSSESSKGSASPP